MTSKKNPYQCKYTHLFSFRYYTVSKLLWWLQRYEGLTSLRLWKPPVRHQDLCSDTMSEKISVIQCKACKAPPVLMGLTFQCLQYFNYFSRYSSSAAQTCTLQTSVRVEHTAFSIQQLCRLPETICHTNKYSHSSSNWSTNSSCKKSRRSNPKLQYKPCALQQTEHLVGQYSVSDSQKIGGNERTDTKGQYQIQTDTKEWN